MRGKVLKPLSRDLRRGQTDAEVLLWRYLRAERFQGVKFRRQQPLGRYIVDFCSLGEKLVIEVDGGQHVRDRDKDTKRTRFLEQMGFRVFRVWDNEVIDNVDLVLEYIRQQLKAPSPGASRRPLPSRERS